MAPSDCAMRKACSLGECGWKSRALPGTVKPPNGAESENRAEKTGALESEVGHGRKRMFRRSHPGARGILRRTPSHRC